MLSTVPLDCSITLPEAVDFQIQHNAHRTAYVFAASDELTTISLLEHGRACHRAAHAVCPLDKVSPLKVVADAPPNVVGVMALADTCVYQATVVGIMRAGLVPFPMSPRNSVPAVINLLKKTSCHKILVTKQTLGPLLDGVIAALKETDPDYGLELVEMPGLRSLFPKLGAETAEDPFSPYPKRNHPLDSTAIYIHSSGSTGLPKPIPLSHRFLIHNAGFPTTTDLHNSGSPLLSCALSLPPFHAFGFFVQATYPLFSSIPLTIFPPTVYKPGDLPMTPTPDAVLDHAVRSKADVLLCVPTFLQIWAQSPSEIEKLRRFQLVTYGGGPLPPRIGNYLVSLGIALKSGYGGTEFGAPVHRFLSSSEDEPSDWSYLKFSDRAKIRWVDHGQGIYEAQFLACDTHTLAKENLPDVRGYTPADLFERHPTKDYFWRIVGRLDDVIVHSSGEKTVPAPLELVIMQSPFVEAAVVFGHGYDQAGVLIQPKLQALELENHIDMKDAVLVENLRNKLWPMVEEANQIAPASSRIFKEMILIASPSKPLLRSPKGSILRRQAISAYHEEIQQLYGAVETNSKSSSNNTSKPTTWSYSELQQWLLMQAQDILPSIQLTTDSDLFRQGLDSLSATILRLRIISALQPSPDGTINPNLNRAKEKITQNIIYSYPTIDRLAMFLSGIVSGSDIGGKDEETLLVEMIERYTSGLDPLELPCSSHPSPPTVVLLTGSTGSLGSQLLASLLLDKSVEKVYALNRPLSTRSIKDRHLARFTDSGLDLLLIESAKLVFVETEMDKVHLGLTDGVYTEIQECVTVIIHNAWQLDFNMSLSFFEPNIRATRNLVDLARSSPNPSAVRLLFTSSIGIAVGWDQSLGPYPEKIVDDPKRALGGGYRESKYVAEHILQRSGLPQKTTLRIGQIAGGPPNGAWSLNDWVPILVKSSLEMGILPDLDQEVTWMPVNIVTGTVLDIAFFERELPEAVNVVHPNPVSWSSLFQHLRKSLIQRKQLIQDDLRIVSLKEWVARLTECAQGATEKEMQRNPAIKLLEFFKRFGTNTAMATAVSESYSPSLRDAPVITYETVDLWVKYWVEHGL